MKILCLIFCAFLILANAAFPQAPKPAQKLEGFLDIPFGSNQEAVKKQLPDRSRARFNRAKSKDNYLWFDGGKFAGFKADHFALEFVSDRLWNVTLHLQAVSKDHEKEFAAFQQMLTEKYGPGKDEPGPERTNAWYLPGAGSSPNTIRIKTDPAGVGLVIWYLSDDVRLNSQPQAKAPPAAQPQKPIKTTPNAKDDL